MRKRSPNPPQPTSPAIPKTEPSDDMPAFRASLKSFIWNILDANPILSRFYADAVIAENPNSRAAKILRANYQKIVERTSMPSTCTHIKVTGVRCGSPTLHGEQYCYFHQRVVRGIRPRPQSRLHPIAILEDEESIQASLMEVVNALLRNTIDLKRAELILRALHIAVKNARRVKFGTAGNSMVRSIPEQIRQDEPHGDGRLARPDEPCGDGRLGRQVASKASVEDANATPYSAYEPEPELDVPYTAAMPPTNYSELAEERRYQAKIDLEQARQAKIRAGLLRAQQTVANRAELDGKPTQIPPHNFKAENEAADAPVGTAAPSGPGGPELPGRSAVPQPKSPDPRLPHPARLSQGGPADTRKPPQKAEAKIPPQQKKARPEKRA